MNRTRLECKGKCEDKWSDDFYIWIEPDWNVKNLSMPASHKALAIWIEPDWNVKNGSDYIAKNVIVFE